MGFRRLEGQRDGDVALEALVRDLNALWDTGADSTGSGRERERQRRALAASETRTLFVPRIWLTGRDVWDQDDLAERIRHAGLDVAVLPAGLFAAAILPAPTTSGTQVELVLPELPRPALHQTFQHELFRAQPPTVGIVVIDDLPRLRAQVGTTLFDVPRGGGAARGRAA